MTRSPLQCCTSIIRSSALVQASFSLSIGRTCAWPRRLPVNRNAFSPFFARVLFTLIIGIMWHSGWCAVLLWGVEKRKQDDMLATTALWSPDNGSIWVAVAGWIPWAESLYWRKVLFTYTASIRDTGTPCCKNEKAGSRFPILPQPEKRQDWVMSHTCIWHVRHTNTSCHSHGGQGWTRMQRTATHCSTLQHTAAQCSTLQHTAAHCSTL